MATNFTLTDAGDIALAPFMYREKRVDDVRRQHHAAEAERASGVCVSGMGPEAFRDRGEAEQRASAQAAYGRAQAFGESAIGRFLMALHEIAAAGFGSWAETARSAASRGFMDDRAPASLGEVAAALRALDQIEDLDVAEVAAVPVAEAVRALGDILAERRIQVSG